MSAAHDLLVASGDTLELEIVDSRGEAHTSRWPRLVRISGVVGAALLDPSDCRQLAAQLTALAREIEAKR